MTADEYRRLEELFHPALRLDQEERKAFLDRECADSPELRLRIERMLASVSRESNVLPGAQPERIGNFRVVETLGEGGMGIVYLALQEDPIRRQVAVKLIRRGMDTGEVLARFELERQTLALMDHPGIAKVFEAGATDKGRPYFVMEYIAGEPITRFCDAHRLTVKERLNLFVQVAEAVQHAHLKAIIHRDLKPSNIIVSEQDGVPVARIIDFGIAKATSSHSPQPSPITEEGGFVGTPEYTSPEQLGIGATDVDLRTDVYSLGVLLYELLAGHRPIESPSRTSVSLAELTRRLVAERPRPPSTRVSTRSRHVQSVAASRQTTVAALRKLLRGELDWITLRAMDTDRARRYSSARELADDVRRFMRREPVSAGPPGITYRLRKAFERNPVAVAGAFSAVLATVLGGVTAAVLAVRAEVARIDATRNFERARLATAARDKSLREKDRALRRSEGLRLAATAGTLLESDPGTALHVAIAGAQRYRNLETNTTLFSILESFVPHRFLDGHEDLVIGVSFSRDGQRVATASLDGTARLWKARNAEPYAVLHSPDQEAVHHVAFSPSGERLVTASKPAKIWRSSDGRELVTLSGHGATVRFAEFSPDGSRVVTASHDRTVRLWDARIGKELARFEGHKASVFPARFSPDGSRVVSGSRDRTARVWSVEGGEVAVLRGHGGTLHDALFSPSGNTVMTSCVDGKVRIWDPDSGILLRALPSRSRSNTAVYNSRGDRVASGCTDGTVIVWVVDSDSAPLRLEGHDGPVTDVAFGRERECLFSCGYDKTVRVWDLTDGTELARLGGHTSRVQRIAVGPQDALATASFDHRAAIWPPPLQTASAPFPDVLSTRTVVFDGAGRITTAHDDGTLRVWSAGDYAPLGSVDAHSDRVTDVITDPGGEWLATSSWDRTVRVWKQDDRSPIAVLRGHEDHVLGLAHSRVGLLVSRSRDRTARVWSTADWKLISILRGHEALIHRVEISAGGDHVSTVGRDGTARLWNARRGEELRRVRTGAAALAPDGRSWAWDAKDAVALSGIGGDSRELRLETGGEGARSIEFSGDGQLVIAACGSDSARIWRTATGKLVQILRDSETLLLKYACFSPDGNRALTRSQEGTIRLWDTATGTEQATVRPRDFRPNLVSFDPSCARVVAVSGSGQVRIWPVDPLEFALRLRPRDLTADEADHFEIGDREEREARAREEQFSDAHELLDLQETMIASGVANRALHLALLRTLKDLLSGDDAFAVERAHRFIEGGIDRGDTVAVPLLVTLADVLVQKGLPAKGVALLERACELPATPMTVTKKLAALRGKLLPDAVTCRSVDALLAGGEPAAIDAFRGLAAARAGDSGLTLAYLDARLAERQGRYGRALQQIIPALKNAAPSDAPLYLLAARCHLARGRPAESEAVLRRALGEKLTHDPRVWDTWVRVALVDLERSPAEMLTDLERGRIDSTRRPGRDYRWLLQELAEQGVLRVNCGGDGLEDSAGRVWSEDRFFSSGDRMFGSLYGSYYLSGFYEPVHGASSTELYRSARLFRPAERDAEAYRFPLPPGDYTVTLHFAGLLPRPRSFDVLLQGETVLEEYDPRGGLDYARLDEKRFPVTVRDGHLEIRFRAHRMYPYVAALEIEPR